MRYALVEDKEISEAHDGSSYKFAVAKQPMDLSQIDPSYHQQILAKRTTKSLSTSARSKRTAKRQTSPRTRERASHADPSYSSLVQPIIAGLRQQSRT